VIKKYYIILMILLILCIFLILFILLIKLPCAESYVGYKSVSELLLDKKCVGGCNIYDATSVKVCKKC